MVIDSIESPIMPSTMGQTLAYKTIEAQIQHVLNIGELTEAQCVDLCEKVRDILQEEPNCVNLRCPICVVGDIHGQFQDFKELLHINGHPPETNYVFLGDYVDRGESSVKTATLAFLLKLRFPERVCLLRGNHETRQITQVYGFYDECMRTYGNTHAWCAFNSTFDFLPLAAVIEGRVFCTHASLSPWITVLDDIRQLDRFREVPHEGPMCDLLWSDPGDVQGWAVSRRGAGHTWGQDVSEMFKHQNRLDVIMRAHECVMEGYQWCHEGSVLTVFSAPNYAYRVGNQAAVVDIDEHMHYAVQQFSPAPARREPAFKVLSAFPDHFETQALEVK